MSDRLSLILNFTEVIDPFKAVERATYLSDLSRHETDSDHTWHMAMFAILLHDELNFEVDLQKVLLLILVHDDELNFEVDLQKVLLLILVHDLCEIYAGDTFAHSPQHGDHEGEQEAVERLFAPLPPDLQDTLLGYWREFTFGSSPEAQYARALDRLQGLAQNIYSSGRVWEEHKVTEQMSRDLNREAMSLDPILAESFERLYQRANLEKLFPD